MLEGRYTDPSCHPVADALSLPRGLKVIATFSISSGSMFTYQNTCGQLARPGYEPMEFSKSIHAWHRSGTNRTRVALRAPRHLVKLWNVKNIYITENGCGTIDEPAADGIVRQRRSCTCAIILTSCSVPRPRRARARLFHWSSMDNFEWSGGYGTASD